MPAITKRTALSLTAKLFDPLGWLASTMVRAKILIQAIWLLGIDWDTFLPESDVQQWHEFRAVLPFLEDIRVPRWLIGGSNTRQELHGFTDASERAFATAVCLQTEDQDGISVFRLLAAKTRVLPLKQVTLPRLELCAATLLVRLVYDDRSRSPATPLVRLHRNTRIDPKTPNVVEDT